MNHQRLTGTGRLLGLGAGLGAAAIALTARLVEIAPQAGSPAARVEDWVEVTVVGAAAVAAAWVAVGALLGLAVVAASRAGLRWRTGEAAIQRLAPGIVRRLVRAGLGVGVGASLALTPATAFAAPDAGTDPAITAESSRAAEAPTTPVAPPGTTPETADAHLGVDLAWQPTIAPEPTAPAQAAQAAPTPRDAADVAPATPQPAATATTPATPAGPLPTAGPAAAEQRTDWPQDAARTPDPAPALPAAPSATHDDGTVVVLRGDTLWAIAARALGGHPTDGQILAATLRWHEANRSVIGDDPDLVRPGQILVPPS
ncbi:hypothetical protein ET495_08785 [Xylanimonas allomyrinae]|uniref:LysM domain-containing protein n=1 Tax=Xylanimonas allomyrinae TaxID=2509459 RepID=A0A4P6EZ37_9MICO|nr:LysM domain-containing protein [Xylanimonas allomyrinae]QAY63328.1 hypothetical protein ET495_08785 [Xylanimonas allomyrinae]